MSIWTIQHCEIVRRLPAEVLYLPDFKYSHQIHKAAYELILKAFMRVNDNNYFECLKGLVFCFYEPGVNTLEELFNIRAQLSVLNQGDFQLLTDQYRILKLSDKLTWGINPIPIYLCNYIALLEGSDDGVIAALAGDDFHGYSYEEFCQQQRRCLFHGELLRPLFSGHNRVIQVHLPCLLYEMVEDVGPASLLA